MHFQQSERALDVMRCARPEQRRSSRIQLPVRAMAVFPAFDSEPQTALLRDINMLGAFFYCKHIAEIGGTVRLNFVIPNHGHPMHIVCEGVVVRVEAGAPLAATGMAVQFSKYEVVESRCSLDYQAQRTSYLGWSMQMVEEMFARRPELEHFASRIQGAA